MSHEMDEKACAGPFAPLGGANSITAMYRIPRALIIGFGRSQILQYICAFCGECFFPFDRHEVLCEDCESDKRAPDCEESPAFHIDIVGWEQRFQATQRRSSYNFRKVLVRDEYACRYCGYSPAYAEEFMPLHVDHIIPHSHGGNNGMANLVVACQWCNVHLSNKVFDSFIEKRIYITEIRKAKGMPITANQWREMRPAKLDGLEAIFQEER
jgi:hypothetical protein